MSGTGKAKVTQPSVPNSIEPNLWENILDDHKETRTQLNESADSIIFLGGANDGAKSLARELISTEKSYNKKHDDYCIEYSFLKVNMEDKQEDIIEDRIVGIWRLEETKLPNLMDFALTKNNIEHSVVIITADITRPKDVFQVCNTHRLMTFIEC
jgi:hypothetical protein